MKNVFSPTCPHRAEVSGGAPGDWDAGSVRTHNREQHVVQQQREEHDEQDELPRVPALLQPAGSASSLEGHGSWARLQARRAVRGRAGPPAPRPPGLARPGPPEGARERGSPGGARRSPASPSAHVRRARSHRHLRSGVKRPRAPSRRDPRHGRRSAAAPTSPSARSERAARHPRQASSLSRDPSEPRVAPPGASPDLGRALSPARPGGDQSPAPSPAGGERGRPYLQGGLRLPALAAVGSVWPAGSGRSLHPSARPAAISLPGPALTSRPARGRGRGLGRPGLRPPSAVAFLSPPRPGPALRPDSRSPVRADPRPCLGTSP